MRICFHTVTHVCCMRGREKAQVCLHTLARFWWRYCSLGWKLVANTRYTRCYVCSTWVYARDFRVLHHCLPIVFYDSRHMSLYDSVDTNSCSCSRAGFTSLRRFVHCCDELVSTMLRRTRGNKELGRIVVFAVFLVFFLSVQDFSRTKCAALPNAPNDIFVLECAAGLGRLVRVSF